MSYVSLSGQLICSNDAQASLVRRLLPSHIQLTHAEPGCLSFEVRPTRDPLIWQVEERFSDAAALQAHQERASESEWGLATAGIERRYTIDTDDGP